MESEMMYKMFASTIEKMNDEELEKALVKLKAFVSPSDYEKIVLLINERRGKNSQTP